MELKQYAEKFPSKLIWHDHILSTGYYLPDIDTYRWKWGIDKALKNQCNLFVLYIFFN